MSGRISSFGGVPPSPSLNSPSPSLYLFLSPPPPTPNPFSSRCDINCLAKLGCTLKIFVHSLLFGGFITSEWTMCWHGDEEDEDSSEVTCCCLVDLCVAVIVAVISRNLTLSLSCCLLDCVPGLLSLQISLCCVANYSSGRSNFWKDTGSEWKLQQERSPLVYLCQSVYWYFTFKLKCLWHFSPSSQERFHEKRLKEDNGQHGSWDRL